MKLSLILRCLTFLVAAWLVSTVHGQYSNYTMYFQSGPVTTMGASSGSTGFEIPIERTNHSFTFKWRTTAGGPVNSASTYPRGFVTSSGSGATAVIRSFMVTASTPPTYQSTPTYYTYNGTVYTSYTSTYVPFACHDWWLVDTTANQESYHVPGTLPRMRTCAA